MRRSTESNADEVGTTSLESGVARGATFFGTRPGIVVVPCSVVGTDSVAADTVRVHHQIAYFVVSTP